MENDRENGIDLLFEGIQGLVDDEVEVIGGDARGREVERVLEVEEEGEGAVEEALSASSVVDATPRDVELELEAIATSYKSASSSSSS